MSDTSIIPFLFEGESLMRVVMREGEPWFVAADVCKALGLAQAGSAVRSLAEDEKGVQSLHTLGGDQDLIVINESGLYTLVFRSQDAVTPGTFAFRFRRWVTGEVLPSIRKTGSYDTGRRKGAEAPDITGTTLRAMKLIGQLRQERDREVRAMLYQSLVNEMASIGRSDVPALESLGRETPPPPDILRQFWRAYQRMLAAGIQVNHSASPGLIALNLNELREHMVTHGPDVQIDTAMRTALRQSTAPKFLANKAIRSALFEGRTVKCWVFEE